MAEDPDPRLEAMAREWCRSFLGRDADQIVGRGKHKAPRWQGYVHNMQRLLSAADAAHRPAEALKDEVLQTLLHYVLDPLADMPTEVNCVLLDQVLAVQAARESGMTLHLPPLGEFSGEARVAIKDTHTGQTRVFETTIGPGKVTSEPGYWLSIPEVCKIEADGGVTVIRQGPPIATSAIPIQ